MKLFFILIACIVVALFVGSFDHFFRHKPVKSPDMLRNTILASISNPFTRADTLVLNTRWMFCGNSDPDELPIVFDTQLDSAINKDKLSHILHLPVLTMAEFYKVMDTIRKYRFGGEYPPGLWDTCRIGKVSADIKAEQLSSKKIRLYESYLYNDTSKYIRKEFVFSNGKWIFNIIDSSTSVLEKVTQ